MLCHRDRRNLARRDRRDHRDLQCRDRRDERQGPVPAGAPPRRRRAIVTAVTLRAVMAVTVTCRPVRRRAVRRRYTAVTAVT